eukprot:CAMPEP_0185756066 /NCGR_PEP_ID=MMETSP1174-20130828/14520_1 /TAXON_ID=35687 /ORGANISM="Dictyocha speculum, Strain CCMP1381" /LENGTH=48 /DNA_ID= /DNA_START= /DNA_END= /DNA_ORIENTATION=
MMPSNELREPHVATRPHANQRIIVRNPSWRGGSGDGPVILPVAHYLGT